MEVAADDFLPLYRFEYQLDSGRRIRAGQNTSPQLKSGSTNPKWQMGVNWDLGTIKINARSEKMDSVNQRFPGMGGLGNGIMHVPTGLFINIPEEFQSKVTDFHSVENDGYLTYTFPEYYNLDQGVLNGIPGQAGVENNDCGDAAFPSNAVALIGAASALGEQWAIERVGFTAEASAWDAVVPGAKPVVVGIIDTGLDWNHLDLAWENIWRNEDEIPDNGIDDDDNGYIDDIIGWDFVGKDKKPWDNDGHGTFVAGIIAATIGNDIGIDGINPNARIMVLKALNNFGRTRASYVAQAIVYGVDNGAQILNLSVVGAGLPDVVQQAIDYADSKGVIVVAAAGNRAENIDEVSPAGLQHVLSVAATDTEDQRAYFSNVGDSIALAAPGVDVMSLRARRTDFMLNNADSQYEAGSAYVGEDNRYYRASGTSFSAPIVTGVASLVWSNRPDLSHAQVRQILEQSARDVGPAGRDRLTGFGIVDPRAALLADPDTFISATIDGVGAEGEGEEQMAQVFGSADADQFARAWLEIGAGEEPTSFERVSEDLTEAVSRGMLGQFPARVLENEREWVVRLVVEHQNGRSRLAQWRLSML